MKVRQMVLRAGIATSDLALLQAFRPDLVLVFGAVATLRSGLLELAMQALPDALWAGCSCTGGITAPGIVDDGLVLTALHFNRTRLRVAVAPLPTMADSQTAGEALAAQLDASDLRSVLVFAPGTGINGSALVSGLQAGPLARVGMAGALAGGDFAETLTVGPSGIKAASIVAVGLYGKSVELAQGSYSGWRTFGAARRVTRASGNCIYELDGELALPVYRRFLGRYAEGLPATGQLFPFAILDAAMQPTGTIRTLQAVDETAGSLTLAGAVCEDGYVQLMLAATRGLVSGAEAAAQAVARPLAFGDTLGLVFSCAGRRMVMSCRADEEIEAVAEVLGSLTPLAGGYVHGEIYCGPDGVARLDNQTMLIACLSE